MALWGVSHFFILDVGIVDIRRFKMVKDNKVYIRQACYIHHGIPGEGIYISSAKKMERSSVMYLHPDGQWRHSMKGEEDVDTFSGYFLDVESAVSLARSLGYDVSVQI